MIGAGEGWSHGIRTSSYSRIGARILIAELGSIAVSKPRFRKKTSAAMALSVCALVAPSQVASAQDPKTPATSTVALAAATTVHTDSYVNIVAHQDDDVLFLNPDLAAPLRAGSPTVTVFLTAGEACGVGGTCASPVTSREDFAAARQAGSEAAYASMAGVANTWDRQAINGAGGTSYELYTLHAAPQIKLIFLDIRDGGDSSDASDSLHYSYSLTNLDNGSYPQIRTIVPTGAVVTSPQTYTKAGLIQTLRGVFDAYQPTVVRTQSPGNVYGYHYDNADHKDAAYFTDQALTAYHGPGGDGRLIVEHYRDYDTDNLPDNLSAAQRQDKQAIFAVYAAHDANVPSPIPATGNYAVWPKRLYDRWPTGTTWTAKDADGRLEAFAVEDNQVVRWYQTSPGGAWAGPQTLGGAGTSYLAPQIAVGSNADGRLQLFATRYDGLHDTSELVTAAQTTAGGGFGGWTSLGNPDGAHYQTGVPTVVANADGRLQVFVKNYHGKVSSLTQTVPGGAFASWTDLGGPAVGATGLIQDGLAAATDRSGRIELFATQCQAPSTSTPDDGNGGAIYDSTTPQPCWVTRWAQTTPNGSGAWDTQKLITNNIDSAPTVAANQDGRLQVFVRQGGGSDVLTVTENTDDTWSHTAADLAGNGGSGTPAVLATPGTDGRIVVLERDNASGMSLIGQPAANAAFGSRWTAVQTGLTEQLPAGNVDSTGRAVLFTLGTDGRLQVAQQTTPGSQFTFDAWQAVGAANVPGALAYVNGSSSPVTVSGLATLTAFVASGTEVDYLLDGVVVNRVSNGSVPYTVSMNTRAWADGPHTVTVQSKDATGTVLATSAPASIVVNQGGGQATQGDFNGDGLLDLAVFSPQGTGSALTLFYGQPAGGWDTGTLVWQDAGYDWSTLQPLLGKFGGAAGNDTVGMVHPGRNGDTLVTLFWVDKNNPKAALTPYDNADLPAFDPVTAKFVTGDFNSDGLLDLAAVTPQSNSSGAALTLYYAKAGGGWDTGTRVWQTGAYDWSTVHPLVGKFGGAASNDTVAVARPGTGGDTLVSVFPIDKANPKAAVVPIGKADFAGLPTASAKFVTGDFDSDGSADIAVFSAQGAGSALKLFYGQAAGGWDAGTSVWQDSGSGYAWSLLQPLVGKFAGAASNDTVAIAHAGGNSDTLVTVYWVDPNNPKAPLTAYDNADITQFAALSAKFG